MAGIQEYLNIIKNGVYGRDIRQAIHDGIQQCYSDIVDPASRQQLVDRIDTIENETMHIDAIAPDYALGRFLKRDGTEGTSTAYGTSDYIEIPNASERINSKLAYSAKIGSSNAASIAFYNSEKTFMDFHAWWDTEVQTIDIPTNAKYIRICSMTDTMSSSFYGFFVPNVSMELNNEVETDRWMDISKDRIQTMQAWYRFSDITRFSSTAAETKVYDVAGLTKARVFKAGDYASVLGIGFFSDTDISNDTIIRDSSYPHTAGSNNGEWREVTIPSNAVIMTVTTLIAVPIVVKTLTRESNSLINQSEKRRVVTYNHPLHGKMRYYHALTDHVTDGENTNIVVPAQSVYDVALAKRLGFNAIEANVHATATAGKYVVTHGISGRLGEDFEQAGGGSVGSVTIKDTSFDDLRSNYRYRSIYPKYQVPITSLEEFLEECKLQNMIPILQYVDKTELDIARGIVGDNMIVYSYSPEDTRRFFDGWILEYRSDTSIANALARCRKIGAPYIYMDSATLSASDMKAKIQALHNEGFLYGLAGNYMNVPNNISAQKNGVDIFSSSGMVEYFDYGNIVNINCDSDYSDLTTDGTVTDGALVLGSGKHVEVVVRTNKLKKYQIVISFTGTLVITRQAFTEYGINAFNETFTGDGQPIVISGISFFRDTDLWIAPPDDSSAIIKSINVKVSEC